jgi:hypothetical protein
MTVFDVFRQVPYTYLVVSRGEVYGNRIVSETQLKGVFKLRSGMTQAANQETRESSATLHVHPEGFSPDDEIVGNGVRVGGLDYQVIGRADGRNFETGKTEHLTLTLQRAEYESQD